MKSQTDDFEREHAIIELSSELDKGESSAKEEGYVGISEVEKFLGVGDGEN